MNLAVALVGGALGAGIVYGVKRARSIGLFGQATISEKTPTAVAIRQIRRYAFAASQDKSPVVGLTHASYALMGLDLLEEVAGRDAIRAAGFDPTRVRQFITKLQDMHAERLQACDTYLQEVLKIERAEGGQLPGFVVAGAGAAPMGA